jgi:hypothetical protein
MAIETQVVTGFISDANGNALTSGSVRFRLSRYDLDDDAVVTSASDTFLAIAADGSIAGGIWPNLAGVSNTAYKVTIMNAVGQPLETLGSIRVGEAGPYELADLIREYVLFDQETLFRVMTRAEYDAVIAASANVTAKADEVALNTADALLAMNDAANDAAQTSSDRSITVSAKDETLAAQAATEAARDAAFLNANVYSSTSAGLSSTAIGVQFQVVAGDEVIRYRHDSGPVATEVARYPAVVAFLALNATLSQSLSMIGQVAGQVNGGRATLEGGTLADRALRIGSAGIYSAAADTLSIVIAGSEVARFTASGLTVYGLVTEV